MEKIAKSKCKLLPLDSEHNAIFQLCDFNKSNVALLIGIDPYPSVTISAVFYFSVPVIATPKLYPNISFRS